MKKIRIGIVGVGQRVVTHDGVLFTDCRDVAEVAALCDIRPERLAAGKAAYEKEHGHPIEGYTDFLEMYRKANLDAVYIAGPNDLHRDMAVPALRAGLHVLCEKPLEVTLARCDEMIAEARKQNRIFAAAMQMHYRRRYHKIAEIIERGDLGRVAMAWCTEYRGPFGPMKDWVWDKRRSGGAIVEKNCHHYDIIDMWVRSDPTTVYATGNIMKHVAPFGKKSEIIDNAWIVNDFENGARAMVGICFLAENRHYREFGVIGTEGKAFFSSADREIVHVEYSNGHVEHYDYRENPWLRGGLFRDFVDCILTGRQPMVTAEMARKSLLVPMAAEKSIEEKRVVHVSELV